MTRLNRAIDVFLVILSITVCLASLRLGIGNASNPGPGFNPFLTSCLLLLLSAIVLLRDLMARAKDEDEGKEKGQAGAEGGWQRPVILIGGLIGYALLLKTLGYLIATFLLLFLMFLMFDPNPRNWWRHVLIGVIASGASFVLFHKWLQVELPAGIFLSIGY